MKTTIFNLGEVAGRTMAAFAFCSSFSLQQSLCARAQKKPRGEPVLIGVGWSISLTITSGAVAQVGVLGLARKNRKGKVQLWQLLAITPPRPPPPPTLPGNKQSFRPDRYMLKHCYLCSQTNQIMDYSSLVLTSCLMYLGHGL